MTTQYNNLGYRDHEAAVRFDPVNELSDLPMAAQYNFEYRAGDATASPYLALGAVVNAGLQGQREDLPMPPAWMAATRRTWTMRRSRRSALPDYPRH